MPLPLLAAGAVAVPVATQIIAAVLTLGATAAAGVWQGYLNYKKGGGTAEFWDWLQDNRPDVAKPTAEAEAITNRLFESAGVADMQEWLALAPEQRTTALQTFGAEEELPQNIEFEFFATIDDGFGGALDVFVPALPLDKLDREYVQFVLRQTYGDNFDLITQTLDFDDLFLATAYVSAADEIFRIHGVSSEDFNASPALQSFVVDWANSMVAPDYDKTLNTQSLDNAFKINQAVPNLNQLNTAGIDIGQYLEPTAGEDANAYGQGVVNFLVEWGRQSLMPGYTQFFEFKKQREIAQIVGQADTRAALNIARDLSDAGKFPGKNLEQLIGNLPLTPEQITEFTPSALGIREFVRESEANFPIFNEAVTLAMEGAQKRAEGRRPDEDFNQVFTKFFLQFLPEELNFLTGFQPSVEAGIQTPGLQIGGRVAPVSPDVLAAQAAEEERKRREREEFERLRLRAAEASRAPRRTATL